MFTMKNVNSLDAVCKLFINMDQKEFVFVGLVVCHVLEGAYEDQKQLEQHDCRITTTNPQQEGMSMCRDRNVQKEKLAEEWCKEILFQKDGMNVDFVQIHKLSINSRKRLLMGDSGDDPVCLYILITGSLTIGDVYKCN